MDYKLESSTKQKIDTDKVIRFIDIAKQKNFYIKLVVNKNIDYSDIYNFMQIDLPKDTQIIIQPVTLYKTNKMDINFAKLSEIQNIILNEFNNVRIIPQSHKYFNIK
jgi:organic radical activating enzyme